MPSSPYTQELAVAVDAAQKAAELVIAHYQTPFHVHYKGAGTSDPVTQADKDANACIIEAIHAAFPNDAILAEESIDDWHARKNASRLWCVDPVDGTQDFVNRTGDFCVMIGLAVEGRAVLGVVLAPVTHTLYAGVVEHGAFMQHNGIQTPLHVDTQPQERVMMVSRSHLSKRVSRVTQHMGIHRIIPRGSVGLKMCAIAQGQAHGYLSYSTRMQEWDTCGPEAIVRAAGGTVTDVQGQPLCYNKEVCETPAGILASNGTEHDFWCNAALHALT